MPLQLVEQWLKVSLRMVSEILLLPMKRPSVQILIAYLILQRGERGRFYQPLHGSICHTFVASQFTEKLKVVAQTSQGFIAVIKPNREIIRISTLYGSSGPVYSDISPLAGEYRVCVSNGTLSITLERKDMMDSIIKYPRPVENTTQFFTTSSPPPACKLRVLIS